MARYREKDELDLVWNRIRRQLTRDLDTRMMNFRENLLNQLLTEAFDRYTKALETGKVIELEDQASSWVEHEMKKHFAIEAQSGSA